jgi:hypothetical protein
VKRLLLVAALLAACGKSPTAAPALPDPTVLVTNQATDIPGYPGSGKVTLSWWDQSGKVQTNTIAPLSTQCVAFVGTTPLDSVRVHVVVGDSGVTNYAALSTPWFFPGTNGLWTGGGAFWTVTATYTSQSGYNLDLRPAGLAPC